MFRTKSFEQKVVEQNYTLYCLDGSWLIGSKFFKKGKEIEKKRKNIFKT
jgi:hypothetical protein